MRWRIVKAEANAVERLAKRWRPRSYYEKHRFCKGERFYIGEGVLLVSENRAATLGPEAEVAETTSEGSGHAP